MTFPTALHPSIHTHTHTHTMQQAMEVIGFQPDEISATLELLASVLNLGNVSFVGNTLPDGSDSCSISDMTCKQQYHACTYGTVHCV